MSAFTDALKNPKIASTPTVVQFANLQLAYDYFNKTLFNGELANCLLMFGRDQKNCYGYFHAEQWESAEGKDKCHMISLTPMHLSRPLEVVFSTLVHEMCHLWQQDHGKPSKNGYHNKEWAEKMKEVGLQPTNVKEPEKETGSKVSHTIIEKGPYARAFKAMPDSVKLPWVGAAQARKEKAARNKVKYVCPACEAKVWGKPDMNIVCGECNEQYECEG